MNEAAYLDGSRRAIEVVLDGPSLLVEQAETAPLRLPLQRLTRLVVIGDVRLEPAAIIAALRAGLPLTWLGGDGRPVGTALPTVVHEGDLPQLLDEAAQDPAWAERLANWHAGEERLAVVRLIGRLALTVGDLRKRMVERRLARFLDERAIPPCPWQGEVIRQRLLGLLEARLAALLAREGLGSRFQNPRDPERDLRGPILDLLSLELWPLALTAAHYLREHAAKHPTERDRQRRLVRQFEAKGDEIDRRLAELLGRLRRSLREFLS